MAPTMITLNAGRRTAATRGGRTGGHAGRGGGRSGEQAGRVGGRTSDQGGRGSSRGNKTNGGVDEVLDFSTVIAQQLQGLLPTIVAKEDNRNANLGNGRNGCSYKKFVACNPKEFDGKGGAVAYIRWVEKMEVIQDISGCIDERRVLSKQRNTEVGSKVLSMQRTLTDSMSLLGYYLTWLPPHLVTPETKRIERYIYGLAPHICGMVAATEPPMIQNSILKVRVLTDEVVRNGSLKRTSERKGDGGESSKEGNVKGDNKRARTGKVFATITNPVRKEYTGDGRAGRLGWEKYRIA
ncbi:hypothetical protein Tco_1352578 [Tanacetum coccineum]